MSQIKIVKNRSGLERSILNRLVADNEDYNVQPIYYAKLAEDVEIAAYVTSGEYVINDGNTDLPIDVALVHIRNIQGVVFEHNDITLLPGIGVNAPEIITLSAAATGHKMMVGEKVFGQTRIDHLAGGDVVLQLHQAIDNTEPDRWIQYDVSYFTSSGSDLKPLNVPTGAVTMGPMEVPTVAFGMFESTVVIPGTAWANSEHYLFVGVERVEAVGKTAPTNDPVILRYCKRYYKRLEV